MLSWKSDHQWGAGGHVREWESINIYIGCKLLCRAWLQGWEKSFWTPFNFYFQNMKYLCIVCCQGQINIFFIIYRKKQWTTLVFLYLSCSVSNFELDREFHMQKGANRSCVTGLKFTWKLGTVNRDLYCNPTRAYQVSKNLFPLLLITAT